VRSSLYAHLILPRAPLSISARDLAFPCTYSFPVLSPTLPCFPAALNKASPYVARLARSGTNRMPKRRFPDAIVVRRMPYESKASRLLYRPMWSSLALRQRQSDALITLVWIFCHCLLCQARQKTLRLVGLLVPSIFVLTMISVASLGESE
jgi:hypothetical protein